jgi:hypothetical protein
MIKQGPLVLFNKTTSCAYAALFALYRCRPERDGRQDFEFGLLLAPGQKVSSNISVVGSTSHLTNDSTTRTQPPRNRAPGSSACPKERFGHLGQRDGAPFISLSLSPKRAGGVVVV